MTQIAGALISIVLVLVAVFLPVAFLGGVTGTLYKQFAITISISMVISGIMALTLSPALAAIIVKAHHGEKRGFFRWFESGFARLTNGYVGVVARSIRAWPLSLIVFGALLAGIVLLFRVAARELRAGGGPGLFLRRDQRAGHREPRGGVAGSRRRPRRSRSPTPPCRTSPPSHGYSLIDGQIQNNGAVLFASFIAVRPAQGRIRRSCPSRRSPGSTSSSPRLQARGSCSR